MRFSFLLLCLVLFTTWLPGQPSLRAIKKTATVLMRDKNYEDAFPLLTLLETKSPTDFQVKKMLGICSYYQNQIPLAIQNLDLAAKQKKTADAETFWHLAAAYHANLQFENAIAFYKSFLKNADKKDYRRQTAKEKILNCSFGLKNASLKKDYRVENLGTGINTAADEFGPIQSPNYPDKMYYSAEVKTDEKAGAKKVRIFSANQVNGKWTASEPPLQTNETTASHTLLGFDEKGQKMYFLRGNSGGSGELLVNDFIAGGNPVIFKSPLQVQEGDDWFFLANDSTLLFSSARAGGFGGYDIYASLLKNGFWTLPVNLGPTINSDQDETTPFLAKDGLTLYFSSNQSEQTFGGFDIFKTVFDYENGSWSAPENLGLPLNSASDDLYFQLSADAYRAHFSSDRKSGFGKNDLFAAVFKNQLKEMLPEHEVVTFAETKYSGKKPVPKDPLAEAAKKFQFKNLRYESGTDELGPGNLEILEKAFAILREYPETKILLTACSPQKSEPYTLVKNAEKAADHLLKKGMDPSRIFIRGWEGYSVANLSGYNGEQTGDFVEIHFSNSGAFPHPITYEENQVTQLKGLAYKVQIASTTKNFQSNLLNQYPNVTAEKRLSETNYAYTVGLYQTFYAAEQIRKKILKKGLLGLKVIPYLDGFRLDEANAKLLTKTYPDLKNYLASRRR